MKKIAACLCVLSSLLFSCQSVSYESSEKSQNENYYLPYEIDSKGCITRFYSDDSSTSVVIPSTYNLDLNGKPVSGKSYEIKSIGSYSFANNVLIQTVSIPESIEIIKDHAFYNCANLEKINVTKNIKSIEEEAFESCPNLKAISKEGDKGLLIETNENLSSFSIPKSIEKIDDYSFSNWSSLESISIDNNVISIGNNAFSNCENLSNVVINTSLNELAENAFSSCPKLTGLYCSEGGNGIRVLTPQSIISFTTPDSIKEIQNGFFYEWKKLKTVSIHSEVKGMDVMSTNKPMGVIFKDNDSLQEIYCGNNDVLSLFSNHESYYSKTDSDTMYTIEKNSRSSYGRVYYVPKTLAKIHLLGEIVTDCLFGMSSLQEIYIPSSATKFETGAFNGCSNLISAYFETNSDWKWIINTGYLNDSGIISMKDMNNPTVLANKLKAHASSSCSWEKC